jgi:predicted dithiol-disulfide oxidoreductase (DUF899 family)
MATNHKVVSSAEWSEARKQLLTEEKEFNRLRDQLSQRRRDLPWEAVKKEYVFEGPNGKRTLAELFDGRSQLIVYHFMFAPDWEEGCKSCSFWADNFNGIGVHLNHRDVSFLAISRAPLAKLQSYAKRMGWSFPWYSSDGSDFNFDYQVSFTPQQIAAGDAVYNYATLQHTMSDLVGISVFANNQAGELFHTYSTYSRGLDMLNGAYHYLDLVPNGRNEGALKFTMEWLRRHDQYDR